MEKDKHIVRPMENTLILSLYATQTEPYLAMCHTANRVKFTMGFPLQNCFVPKNQRIYLLILIFFLLNLAQIVIMPFQERIGSPLLMETLQKP